ncbi:MAG: RsmE family RNA methyltransferase [Planctomycetota bacterium]|jgi:16S rRNA (uracil1498-N3)-methyltransferase
MHRFYITSDSITEPGAVVPLPAEEAYHAGRVLRLRVSDIVEVFDGSGNLSSAEVVVAEKRKIEVRVNETQFSERHPLHITAAFCPPKGKRCAAAVEQMTELGIDGLIPLKSERSVADGGDADKWQQRAVEACKQSKRLYVPEIFESLDIKGVAETFSKFDKVYLASLSEDSITGSDLSSDIPKSGKVLWLIGPEGGFSEEEETFLVENGAKSVVFSPNVLRIGTAATVCTALTRFFA